MKIIPSSIMKAFSEVAQAHPLWKHPFLNSCQSGQISLAEVKVLAVQMYKFSKEFNRILARILSCCPHPMDQLVILENLFDEMGEGDLNHAHPELFRRFTRALGIDDDQLEALPTEPETLDLIETYLDLPNQYGYLAALGAVCFASEGIVSSLYTQLQSGILSTISLPKEALVFFSVHVDVDDSHAAKLAALVEPKITSTEAAMNVNRAILDAMDARVRFFDGVQRSASENVPSYAYLYANQMVQAAS